ncbi:MAG: ADP-polyphosphate phosphotransferase [Selenomonadaceae bacterium]
MKINSKDFRVSKNAKVKLNKWATKVKPCFDSKEEYKDILEDHVGSLSDLQRLLASDNHYALLVIFQGMDTAGKDGAIRHVMSGVNPQGCQVYSFKSPSSVELEHDFLWRTTCQLPERGRIGIFNRSYYEEVLIARVHSSILAKQNLPEEIQNKKNIWKNRYRSIADLEKHLHCNGTKVIKFFLHLSKDEQRKRFLERIDDPEKNWKLTSDDISERQYWDDYMEAYGDCLGATSTKKSPWYIVPADDKDNCRIIISAIILETLRKIKMSYPETDTKRLAELQVIRKTLIE